MFGTLWEQLLHSSCHLKPPLFGTLTAFFNKVLLTFSYLYPKLFLLLGCLEQTESDTLPFSLVIQRLSLDSLV